MIFYIESGGLVFYYKFKNSSLSIYLLLKLNKGIYYGNLFFLKIK